MKKYKELLSKFNLKPLRYQFVGRATIIDTESGSFVIKEKVIPNDPEIYSYLNSRSFNYYPKLIDVDNEEFVVMEKIEEINMPLEQKAFDMIELVGLLHNKTTFYKEIDEDDNKKIYEDILGNIEHLTGYYNDIASVIESKVFMSPSEYLFIRNISKIFASLQFCHQEIERWYSLIKEKRKQRFVVLHNNLELDHFIRNENSYLISWEKSKIGLPIFDLYKLYRNQALDLEFSEILKKYETYYRLLEEERILLFILIALPDKIEFNGEEYDKCRMISKKLDMLYKAEMVISPYYSN